jgi:prepilin-type N-terminal cleavage/methylation domain-containing protein
MKSRVRCAAFTLVEVLVVIAIVGVLAAMLLPSLNEARETARRVICASNEHQLIVAVHTYGDDYKRTFWGNWVAQDLTYDLYFPGAYVVNRSTGDTGWTVGPGYGHHDVYGAKPVWQVGYSNYLGGGGNAWSKISVDPGSRYLGGHDAAFDAFGIARHTTYRYFVNEGGLGWGDALYAPWGYNPTVEKKGRPDTATVTECQSVMYNDQYWRVVSHFTPQASGGSWTQVRGSSGWKGHNVGLADGHVKWVSPDMMVPAGTQPLNPGSWEVNMWYQGNAIQTLTVYAGDYHGSPWWWNTFSAWGL